jgi:hypothetical protein
MRTLVDARLRTEAERFRLRFACADCVYFAADERRCSEGYPIAPHERRDLERTEVVFCKLFEGA